MFELSIKTHFSAAHHLEGYPGSCAAFHGHNWEVEVFIRGRDLDGTGFLEDFRVLKRSMAEALADLDHTDLNAAEALKGLNPTSENMARFLFYRLANQLNNERYWVSRVCVGETPGTSAAFWETE